MYEQALALSAFAFGQTVYYPSTQRLSTFNRLVLPILALILLTGGALTHFGAFEYELLDFLYLFSYIKVLPSLFSPPPVPSSHIARFPWQTPLHSTLHRPHSPCCLTAKAHSPSLLPSPLCPSPTPSSCFVRSSSCS